MESLGSGSPKKRLSSAGGFGSSPNRSGKRVSKKDKDKIKKMEGENKRGKRADDNKKILFNEIKKLLDKGDDE